MVTNGPGVRCGSPHPAPGPRLLPPEPRSLGSEEPGAAAAARGGGSAPAPPPGRRDGRRQRGRRRLQGPGRGSPVPARLPESGAGLGRPQCAGAPRAAEVTMEEAAGGRIQSPLARSQYRRKWESLEEDAILEKNLESKSFSHKKLTDCS
ncbi:vasodilator-stimulated phosphoprotein-like [Malaclemys terrapin pileata]|uniref:vasodilator-stimulated phosphoprotein-like n=1 Tax=Malaclemys terrapin pileata TaxID=2991368 RepID=UPI0023A8E2F4|nr:vasodilator-stimulated phosphoprotein-like [Malaclemys terrapin pileata]